MLALVTDSSSPAVKLVNLPEPKPARGELLLKMEAASINRGEIRNAPHKPRGTPIGWDVAGTILATGADVSGFAVGQRVVSLCLKGGTFAEQVVVPAEWTAPLGELDFVRGCALPVAGITASEIIAQADIAAGEEVLITGAAGGVGVFAVQLAARLGATVTGQARNEERGQVVRDLGATHALIHAGDGAQIDERYDVALDGIGGPMFSALLRALKPKGRLVIFGSSSDTESRFDVEDLYPKCITVMGFRIAGLVPPSRGAAHMAKLAAEVQANRLKVPVAVTAKLSEAVDVARALYERNITGKAVLTS